MTHSLSATILFFSGPSMTIRRAVLVITLPFVLAACGIKGGLYIPERPAATAADSTKPQAARSAQ
ncbi:LPS translocon maturation chaperone LptM [Denitromonas sp.]|uniref:LPS translocon maturation chaperone LptM n=1 Tax=Denitromonas sp. TaxID=2734609 RepID=UPI002AFFF451|nr:lipoprotein [Denitromonas sp.]